MAIDTGSIYDQILKLKIDLDFEDIPTPSYLQDKILECSDALRSVEKRIIEVTRELSIKQKSLKLEQVRLEIKKRGLLVNDESIKKLPAAKERESAADEKLQADHERVLGLENDVMELQNLLSSVRLVHQNLRMTNSDIRVLMRIMEQQISKLNIGTKDDKEVRDLAAGLAEVERLEDELTLDDVESTSETIEPDALTSRSEETTPIQTDTVSDEAGGESGESEVIESETLTSRSEETTPTQTDTVSDEAGGNLVDDLLGIASFLTDDPMENGETTVQGDDEEETEDAESAQVPPTQVQEPKQNKGLNIDLSDILDEAPQGSSQKSTTIKGGTKTKAESTKKTRSPEIIDDASPEKEVKKASRDVELDIDDIINSLDD